MKSSRRFLLVLICLLTAVFLQAQTTTSPATGGQGSPPSGANKPPAANPSPAPSNATGGNSNSGATAGSDKSSPNTPNAPNPSSTPTPSKVDCATNAIPKKPTTGTIDWDQLKNICSNHSTSNQPADDLKAGLQDTLFLRVSVSGSDLIDPDGKVVKPDDLKLVISDANINDSQFAWAGPVENQVGVISTRLQRTQSSKDAWNEVLAKGFNQDSVPVTVASSSKKPFPSSATFSLHLMRFDQWYVWVLLVLVIILAIILLTNNRLKQMLRDDGNVKGGGTAAYSLSKTQMFYWFAIIILCYVLIWIITGDRDTITNDALTLMGISAGTFLGAVSIDSSKKSQAQSQLPDATAKLNDTQAHAAALTVARGPADPMTIAANNAAAAELAAVNQLRDRTLADFNVHFLPDILSDENGISFHRFQIFAWSLVLGAIFITSVLQTLSMPTFGNTLLGLMGISGGTYLGFKFPEQKTP